MKRPSDFSEIYLCREPINLRTSFDGLIGLIAKVIRKPVMNGALFAFTNKRRDRVKAVYWDRSGFAVWSKQLQKERYAWPASTSGDSITLSAEEMAWLLDGIDITRVRRHEGLHFSHMS